MKLEIRGVSKSFPGHHAVLDDVSLTSPEVRTVGLIGPSGGGKSTLLRVIAGLERPDVGEVVLNGQAIPYERESELRAYRKGLGVVFQAFNLFPHLTALENLLLPLCQVHGMDAGSARELATATLQRFDLSAHLHKRPGELSGGQKQRVAIARAVAIRPKVLLFDEPTSALDPEMTAEVLQMIEELREEGRELVLVTHAMGFARRAADLVLFLAKGRIVESGPPEEIFGQPRTAECQQFLSRVLRY